MKQQKSNRDSQPWPGQRQLRLFCFLSLLMAAVWMGCQQDPKRAGSPDAVGNYTLMSVDGKNVPCTVEHDGHTLAVKSGSFAINANGTCSSKVIFSGPTGGEGSREVQATYSRQGSTLTMRWEGAGMTTGTVQGDTFTMNNEGMVFAYKK